MREIDIRLALIEEMEKRHQYEADTLIREELGLCQGFARVDLAVVNGSVHGYEIKSEQDTLARLPGQAEIYNRTLDFVTIVAAPAHTHKISNIVPKWWGIWIAIQDDQGVRFESSREPSKNPDIDPFALAQLLWRDEVLQALTDQRLDAGMRSKPRNELWKLLASELPLDDLGRIVRDRLKRRGADWPAPASPV
jgi:hypothetical protein